MRSIYLYENKGTNKQMRVFVATNNTTNKEFESDNQKKFALEHNITQAQISACLLGKATFARGENGDIWTFKTKKDITYKSSTVYNNLIDLNDDITIENVVTKEKIVFKTFKELKDYFGFTGHSICKDNLIESRWKIL